MTKRCLSITIKIVQYFYWPTQTWGRLFLFIMAKTFNEIERDWFIRQVGRGGPIGELKKTYYKTQGIAGNFLPELELGWLRKIVSNGGGNPNGDYSDLWKRILAINGFRVSQHTDENRQTFYLNYTGSFSPASISGLKLWLKADALSLNDGDAVDTWTDSSGTGNSVTEATNRPLYKTGGSNGKPYVYFDGTNDLLTKSSPVGLPTGTGARSVFIVSAGRAISNYQPMYAYGTAGNNEVFSLSYHSSGYLLSWGYSNDDLVLASSLVNNTTYYFAHQYTGSNIVVRQNGSELANYADTINTGSTALKIGNYINDAYPGPVNIYEVLIYNSFITGTDLTNVENYLKTKYGL